jgi:hypothetical protein
MNQLGLPSVQARGCSPFELTQLKSARNPGKGGRTWCKQKPRANIKNPARIVYCGHMRNQYKTTGYHTRLNCVRMEIYISFILNE